MKLCFEDPVNIQIHGGMDHASIKGCIP